MKIPKIIKTDEVTRTNAAIFASVLSKKFESQTEAASALGISNTYLHDLLCGRRRVSPRVAATLEFVIPKFIASKFLMTYTLGNLASAKEDR